MYGGPIGGGVAGGIGGGGALAMTGTGQAAIFVLLALGLLIAGALLLRSASQKLHRD